VWAVVLLGLLTGLLGAAAVLAPVDADDPVVTWPRAGEAPASTVLPLSPYRPLEFRAEIPCAALQALGEQGGGEALRTLPPDVDATLGSGLVVAVVDGRVRISSGPDLVDEPLPAGRCDYVVTAGAAGTTVARDAVGLAERSDVRPPQVAELETGAEGMPEAAGLRVEMHTDARYQSVPSPLKTVLLVAHGLALTALLVLGWRTWPGRGPGPATPRPSVADGAVVVVSGAWAVLGPVNIDDSWYALMARNAGASGYIGNYVYQFNVTENPFSLSQYALQAWGELGGWSLLWLRMLPLLYGLTAYAVLRVLLGTALGRVADRPGVPWALAAAHLLWFLAYGITLRPETLIVVGTATVMLLAELARRRESLGVLAVATAVAALTMTVSPTALVAVAPLLLVLPWLWRWLRAAGVAERVAAAVLAAAAATAVVPVAFADAALGDVVESVAVHRWYYRQHPWYDEFVHYASLLSQDDRGAWGKRLPVLLTLAVLVTTLVGLGRRAGTRGPTARLLASSALITALGLVSMAATPTKWVNHFGAAAAPATVLLAMALVRSPLPRRAGTAAATIAAAFAIAAAALSYAGPNLWRPFADWGQPFGNHAVLDAPITFAATTPGVGPFNLRNPLLWLAVAGAALWWARRRRGCGLTPDRAVLAVAAAGGVALFGLVFSAAPLSQAPGASVASVNLATATGSPCGLAGEVTALVPAGMAGEPVGDAELVGDMVAGRPPVRGPVYGLPDLSLWHTDVAGGSTTGELTTGWYPVPPGADSDVLVLPVTGDLRTGQRVAVEFGSGAVPSEPTAVVEVPPVGLQADWVQRTVPLADAGPERPSYVRVRAEDRLAGEDTWLAVGAPRPATATPVGALVEDRPVFADQVSAVLWPCVDQIAIKHGIAEAPQVRLRAGDGLEDAVEGNSTFVPNGGTLAGIGRTARFVELPSSLDPPGGAPMLAWGHVEEVVYDHPVGRYDVTVHEVRRDGWARLPTLAGEAYTGRGYIG
jgi:hypothetical protein